MENLDEILTDCCDKVQAPDKEPQKTKHVDTTGQDDIDAIQEALEDGLTALVKKNLTEEAEAFTKKIVAESYPEEDKHKYKKNKRYFENIQTKSRAQLGGENGGGGGGFH